VSPTGVHGDSGAPDDVVRVHCVCGQPIHLGLEAGPTFDQHRDRRGPERSCRLILLPDPVTASVSIQRLPRAADPARWLRYHRAQWLARRAR